MSVLADSLPDDLGTLKAMLIAERTQNERLRQIIKELQRHRFGRRAETLPEDQMLLGLEDVDQVVASQEAKSEAAIRLSALAEAQSVVSIADRFLLICHASRWWSILKTALAHAAARPCIGSAKIPANASTLYRRSSASWSFAGPNMAAGPARTWWCRRRRRRG